MAKCRIFYLPDGSVRVVHPVPWERHPEEEEGVYYQRVMSEALESNPDLSGLPSEDMDVTHLPLRSVECQHCGGSHSARNQWRGEQGKGIWIDESLKSSDEIVAHLELDLDAELDQPVPDPVKVLRLQRAIQKAARR